MKDEAKTKAQLIAELAQLRQQVVELEAVSQPEEQLQASERFARAIFDALADHVCVLDENGLILTVNRAWREFARGNPPIPPAYGVGVNYLEVCERASRCGATEAAPLAAGIRAVLRGETREFNLEYPCPSPDQERWFMARITPFPGARPMRLIIIHQDITRQKRVGTALQLSEARYRVIFEGAVEAIIAADPRNRTFYYTNMAATAMFGYSPEEFLQLSVADLHPVDMLSQVLAGFEGMARAEKSVALAIPCCRKDGSLFYADITTSLARLADQPYLVGFFTDITERKQAETALRESEAKYRTLFETMAQGVVYQVTDGRIIAANPAAERILGLTLAQMQGHLSIDPHWRAIHEDGTDFPGETHPAMIALQTGAEVRNVVMGIFNPACTAYRWIKINAVPQFQPGAKTPYQVYTTFDDITEVKQQAAALQHYTDRLQALFEIERAILMAESPVAVGQVALSRLRQLVTCRCASIILFDLEQHDAFVFISNDSDEAILRQGLRFPIQPDWIAELQTGQVQLVNDTLTLSQPAPVVSSLIAGGIRACLNAPMIAQGNLIGALTLAADMPHAFSAPEVEVVREVSNSLAVALQQARLLEAEQSTGQRLRQLTQQLVTVQEEERQRLSRELHDETGQTLTGLKMSLELLQADLPVELHAWHQRLDQVISLTDTTMEQTRRLAQTLRPPALDTIGLDPTLASLCRTFAQHVGLAVDYRGADMPHLPEAIKITLYRVLQEALTNIARHAQASRVAVILRNEGAAVSLAVADDGQGFQSPGGSGQAGGIGLIGMQERLSLLGGQLLIESKPGQGVHLMARIPIAQESE